MGITTAQLTASSGPTQLSNQDPAGVILGSSTDILGFFGDTTPVVQPSGAAQTAIVRGNAGGIIATIASNAASPSAVANATTAEKGITLVGATTSIQIAANDLVYVNKITSQAGLGVGNVRVSAANILGVTFSNFTAATITPTATQVYGVVAIRGMSPLSAVLSPAAVPPNTVAEQQFTLTGVRVQGNTTVQVNKPTSQAGLDIVGCRAVSSGVLGITFANVTAATITPTASEAYLVFQMSGLDAVNNEIIAFSLQSPAATANATTAEVAFTVTGLAVQDVILNVVKPTAQAGLFIGGMRVSAANSLGVTFGNATAATITPTASEVYGVAFYRPSPVAPMVGYTPTLTPVAVAANTTAEQTFTVTGLVAGSPVWVNKLTATQGLGIAGVRVSAANTLAINYCNGTAASITPPAEQYNVSNFQVPIPDTGGTWVQTASVTTQQQSLLTNALRSALTNLNLIAGA